MKYKLTLYEGHWVGEGAPYAGTVIGYIVRGLPPGESAWIQSEQVDEYGEWRVRRAKSDSSLLTGHFASPYAALAWLQSQIDAEQAGS